MRLHEIATSQIDRMMKTYFKIIGTYSIDDNIINVDGSIILKDNKHAEKLPLTYPHYNLKFGTIKRTITYHPKTLITLEGGPDVVGEDFVCSVNKLTSLKGGPTTVGNDYLAHNNPLVSLEGCPEYVGGKITIPYLEDLPMLKLLFIKGVNSIELGYQGVDLTDTVDRISLILNKYKHTGQKGAIQCAAELSKAGFKGNARL